MKIEVTTDPARIDEFRRAARERSPVDPLERFFKQLPDKFTISEAEHELLRGRRDEAVPRLLEAAGGGLKDAAVAMPAIVALCMLEEPGVLPIARKVLRGTERAGGYSLRHLLFVSEARFLGTDAEIRRRLLARLDSEDPRMVEQAVQECGILGLPGATARFAELLRRPGVPGRGRMAYWISQWAPTLEHLDLIGAAWLDDPAVRGDEGAEFLGTVAGFGAEGSEEVRRAAVELLLRWFAEVRDGTRPLDFLNGNATIHDALVALRRWGAGDRRCVALVADLVRSGHPLVEVFLVEALAVLAEGDPALHRAQCLGMLEGPDARLAREAATSLGRACADTRDEHLVSALRAARVQHGEADEFAEALARIGGDAAGEAAESGPGAQGAMSRMRVLWRTRGMTPERALERLKQLGALPGGRAVAELADEARRIYREDWPGQEEEPTDLLLQALALADVLSGFDTEADVIPPPHDELILRLARSSGGVFAVEAARQTWNLPPGVDEDDWPDDEQREESDYTVEFLHDGRLYAFRARYSHDWYDADSLTVAMNHALREAGRPERYHPLDTEGQDTTLLLVTPEVARVARKELFLPVGKAPESSPGRGRGRGGSRTGRR